MSHLLSSPSGYTTFNPIGPEGLFFGADGFMKCLIVRRILISQVKTKDTVLSVTPLSYACCDYS
jgi:hypothetical protein